MLTVSIIYKITHTASGRVYIGQTINPKRRWSDHKYLARRGVDTYLYSAMRKYGVDSFTFCVVEECDTAVANTRETFWITTYKSHIKPFGFNCGIGGDNGNNSRDPDVRRRISATKRGVPAGPCSTEKAENIRQAKLASGYTHSAETRVRISQNRHVTELTAEWRQNISAGLRKSAVYSLTDDQAVEVLQLFNAGRSKRSISMEFGVSRKLIGRVCDGTYKIKQRSVQ